VKRGDKPFSDGMLGHIKLLSNRTTLDERICKIPQLISPSLRCFFFKKRSFVVFRREPLWKVSMNIRVHPTVRCSFVAEENVFRIVLKEAVGGIGNVGSSAAAAELADSQAGTGDTVQTENMNQEVVVYALKVHLITHILFCGLI
jgi:hypothetical protein